MLAIKATCDPKVGWEKTGEKLIPWSKTKGAQATEPQSTACDLTLDPAAESQLSTLQPRATIGQKIQQGAVRQCRSQGGAGASAADVPSVAVPKVEPDQLLGVGQGVPVALSSGCTDTDSEGPVQAAAGDREPGGSLGQGDQEKGDREERPKEKEDESQGIPNRQSRPRRGGAGGHRHEP